MTSTVSNLVFYVCPWQNNEHADANLSVWEQQCHRGVVVLLKHSTSLRTFFHENLNLLLSFFNLNNLNNLNNLINLSDVQRSRATRSPERRVPTP